MMTKRARGLILFLVVAVVVLLPVGSVQAANFTAGNAADLITAINTSNGNGVADTITLTADITLLVVNNSTNGDNGLPVITSEITIEGDGYTISRGAAAPAFRFFNIDGVTFAGDLTLNNVTLDNGSSGSNGGAIINREGDLELNGSTLSGSHSDVNGGGVYNSAGTVTLSHSVLDGNDADSNGGGLFSDSGTVTVDNSTISNNDANTAGGLHNRYGGGMTVTQSVVYGNTSVAGGGGIFNQDGGSTLAVTNTTVTGNDAGADGGGIYNNGGTAGLRHVTIAGNDSASGGSLDNDAGTVNVISSIVADPNSGDNCEGAITDGGDNLEAEGGGSYTCPGTFAQTTASGVNALADNGGATETMALTSTSPAVDGTGGACGGAPTNGVDQRDYPRDSNCDIGAFEYADRAISGRVWYDTDGDGVQDGTETLNASGVSVTLNPGAVVATTNSAGYYAFTGMAAGTYTLTFEELTGYYYSPEDVGSDLLDSDPDPATRTTGDIVLGAPPDNQDMWDAGLILGTAAELTVTKSNSVGGTTTVGTPWDWELVITNTGSADAVFGAGTTILTDDLPTGPTYPASATAVGNAGVSGTVTCSIVADTLTCTATTPVTIDSATPGNLTVTIAGITASVEADYTNPSGTCEVDPSDVVTEQSETNNDCNSDMVSIPVVSQPDLVVTKSNTVGVGSWDWDLVVENNGVLAADFLATEVILIDQLPAGPTYPALATVTPNAGVTGTIACAIAANTLTCTATTAVSIDHTTPGSFEVSIPLITSAVSGTFTNPDGTCEVDPNDEVAELDDTNNDCNVDAVTARPDLTVTKTNTVGAGSWDWNLAVENGGLVDADFADGDVILTDDLPAGPTYPAAAVVTPNAGVTGTIDCAIAANVMTCTAGVGGVTIDIATPGSFDATIAGITTAVAGNYVNSPGVCEVDPTNAVPERDEANNDCNTNVITVLGGGTVQGGGGGGGGRGRTTTTIVTVTESAPEYISISVDNPAAIGGDTVTYTIIAHNPKNIPLTHVVIYDVFDDLLKNIQVVSTSHGMFTIRGNTLTVNGFTLQPGESATIIVTAVISNEYNAGDVIPNVAVLESPDASVHVSNLALIGATAARSDGEMAMVMTLPGELPMTGGTPEPSHRGWLYASAGAVLLIAAGLILRRRLVHQGRAG